MFYSFFKVIVLAAVLPLMACGTPSLSPDSNPSLAGIHATPWALASTGQHHAAPWQHLQFPGKQPSHFTYGVENGRDAITATAQSSASMLRQKVRVEAADLGHLKFSWKLPDLIQHADMTTRETDDSPVRIVLAFEGERAQFSAKNAMLSELARLLTGEEMPYATLMYVWCNSCETGSVIVNPRTDRIRKLAVESGPGKLNSWVSYERSVRADFEKVFGEPPGALVSIGIMTDTDNTQSTSRAWYGPVKLVSAQR